MMIGVLGFLKEKESKKTRKHALIKEKRTSRGKIELAQENTLSSKKATKKKRKNFLFFLIVFFDAFLVECMFS